MNSQVQKLIPLLLRQFDVLSEDDIKVIKDSYQLYGRNDFEEVVKSEKSIRPFASLLLSQIDCDKEYWRIVHNEYIDRNKPILALVEKLFADYYSKGGKSLCVYENFGALLSSGISIGCFASNDVDMAALPCERDFLIDVFKDNGFVMDARGSHPVDNAFITTFHNPQALNGKGYWFNVMWQATSRSSFLDQSLYNKRLHKSIINDTECYKDTQIRILKPTQMAYFCSLHIACEHFFSASPGMSLYCDVDRVVRNRQVNIVSLKKWSDEDRAGNRISMVQDICNLCLCTPFDLLMYNRSSKAYRKLKKSIIGESGCILNPQLGKFRRLRIELLADNVCYIKAISNKLFKK